MTTNPFQAAARELAPTFAERASHWDKTRTYCWDNVREMASAGLTGMTIPTEYGGAGASFYDAALVVEELAKVCTLSARIAVETNICLLYTSPSPRDRTRSRMPSSA